MAIILNCPVQFSVFMNVFKHVVVDLQFELILEFFSVDSMIIAFQVDYGHVQVLLSLHIKNKQIL